MSGSCSAVARRTAVTMRAAVAVPIEPPRKLNSLIIRAAAFPPACLPYR